MKCAFFLLFFLSLEKKLMDDWAGVIVMETIKELFHSGLERSLPTFHRSRNWFSIKSILSHWTKKKMMRKFRSDNHSKLEVTFLNGKKKEHRKKWEQKNRNLN